MHLPAGIYLLKVNNRNTRIRCEICSKLTIKIPERRQWRRKTTATATLPKKDSYNLTKGTNTQMSLWCFVVTFELITHIFLIFLLLISNKQMLAENIKTY